MDPTILPNYVLNLTSMDTMGSETGGLTSSLSLVQNTNLAGPLVAFLGATFSSVSIVVQLVASLFNVTQISDSSTNPILSNGEAYPTFGRVVPPDTLQGPSIAALVEGFNWRAVATISSTNSFGTQGIQAFLTDAVNRNIEILSSVTFNSPATDLTEPIAQLRASRARIFVAYVVGFDAREVLREANEQGLVGPDYVWILADPGQVLFEDPEIVPLTAGVLGTRPTGGNGPLFDAFLQEWAGLDPMEFPGAGSLSINFFAPFTFDAVYAIALGLHQILEVNGVDIANFTSLMLLDEIRNVDFVGLTGRVAFDDNLDRDGIYSIVNVQNGDFVDIGSWNPLDGLDLFSAAIFNDGTTQVPSDGQDESSRPFLSGSNLAIVIIVIIVGVCFLFLLFVTVVMGLLWLRKPKRTHFYLPGILPLLDQDSQLTQVTLLEVIGKGHFGNVYKGEWKGTQIAAKNVIDEDFMLIQKEVNILKEISGKHLHILAYYGVAIIDEKFYIVSEFCTGGDLLTYVQNLKTVVPPILLSMASQIASGMEYLHTRKPAVLHRDLAARNILLTGDALQPTCKVADFGLSTRVGDLNETDVKQIPVRWAAPEVLTKQDFSTASDVWAYGVLCWEIFSLGDTPYHGFGTLKEVVRLVLQGSRLQSPRFAEDEVWEIIEQCFVEKESRPTMRQLREKFYARNTIEASRFEKLRKSTRSLMLSKSSVTSGDYNRESIASDPTQYPNDDIYGFTPSVHPHHAQEYHIDDWSLSHDSSQLPELSKNPLRQPTMLQSSSSSRSSESSSPKQNRRFSSHSSDSSDSDPPPSKTHQLPDLHYSNPHSKPSSSSSSDSSESSSSDSSESSSKSPQPPSKGLRVRFNSALEEE